MLQLQYLNNKLKKSQLEHILSNYNIKYNTMKREIESKVNILIKAFLEDINSFLEKMEEIAIEKQRVKEFDRDQNTVQILREELNEKNHTQTKLKHQIDLLQMENQRMKALLKETSPSVSPKKYRGKIVTRSFTKRNRGRNSSITPEPGKNARSYIANSPKKISVNNIKNEINNIDNDEDIISSNNNDKDVTLQTVVTEGKSRRVIASVLRDKYPVKLGQKEHKRIYSSTSDIKSDIFQKNNNSNNDIVTVTQSYRNIKDAKNNNVSTKNSMSSIVNVTSTTQKNNNNNTKTNVTSTIVSSKKTNNKTIDNVVDKNKYKFQNSNIKKPRKIGVTASILKNANNSKNSSIHGSNRKRIEPKINKKNTVKFKGSIKQDEVKTENNNIENDKLDFGKESEIMNITNDNNVQSEDEAEMKNVMQRMKQNVLLDKEFKEDKEEKENKENKEDNEEKDENEFSKQLSPLKEINDYENDDKYDDDIIDQEIDEMSSYEKQIISLMGEIQEFQKMNEQ